MTSFGSRNGTQQEPESVLDIQDYTDVQKKEYPILIAMIANTEVLARISAKWDNDLFASEVSRRLGKWCVEHYRQYAEAPEVGIWGYYNDWKETARSEEIAELTGQLLTHLMGCHTRGEYSRNPARLLDIASKYFKKVSQERLIQNVQAEISRGYVNKSEELIAKYSSVELGGDAGVYIFEDKEALKDVFRDDYLQPLFQYPNKLMNRFFINSLSRDHLLAFCGPQKSGKTHWLVDLAWRAATQRCKVAFFAVGDMAVKEVQEMFAIRATEAPLRSDNGNWPFKVQYPTSISYSIDGKSGCPLAKADRRVRIYKDPLAYKLTSDSLDEVKKEQIKSVDKFLWTNAYPNLSLSILGVKAELDRLERQDKFEADVVVIDYVDNLAPVDKREETRDRVNTTWKMMKALAQERHCLVVTGTQTNAAGFKKWVLDRTNFSEDNRKLSHVNGMIGINATGIEKERQITRLNWIVKRKGKFVVYHCLHCAGCLALANPGIVTCYSREAPKVPSGSKNNTN